MVLLFAFFQHMRAITDMSQIYFILYTSTETILNMICNEFKHKWNMLNILKPYTKIYKIDRKNKHFSLRVYIEIKAHIKGSTLYYK